MCTRQDNLREKKLEKLVSNFCTQLRLHETKYPRDQDTFARGSCNKEEREEVSRQD